MAINRVWVVEFHVYWNPIGFRLMTFVRKKDAVQALKEAGFKKRNHAYENDERQVLAKIYKTELNYTPQPKETI